MNNRQIKEFKYRSSIRQLVYRKVAQENVAKKRT
jgi:hypothetical protein